MTHPMLTWYLAQLEADERVARATEESSNPSHWEAGNGTDGNDDEVYALAGGELDSPDRCTEHVSAPNPCDDNPIICVDSDFTSRVSEIARHIALHDPAAVLADIASKRAIIELHGPVSYQERTGWSHDPQWVTRYECWGCNHNRGGWEIIEWPCQTARLLISAYAHREGFDQSWAPT